MIRASRVQLLLTTVYFVLAIAPPTHAGCITLLRQAFAVAETKEDAERFMVWLDQEEFSYTTEPTGLYREHILFRVGQAFNFENSHINVQGRDKPYALFGRAIPGNISINVGTMNNGPCGDPIN